MQSKNPDIIQDVAETACYSRLTEAYMVGNFKQSEFQYFGANNGLFRQIPAQEGKTVGVTTLVFVHDLWLQQVVPRMLY
jgi:galactokinase